MSTKKEKPCCDRCREVSSISGSFNCVGTCQCHQSESIEWDKAFDEKFGKLDAPTEQIKAFLSQTITTAVAKREKELVEEVEKINVGYWVEHNWGEVNEETQDCIESFKKHVLSKLKH